MVGPLVVGIGAGLECVVVGGGDACVVAGGAEDVVVGAGAEAVVVGDAGAAGADDVVVGAGAEDVVTGAAEEPDVDELAAEVAVGCGFGLAFFLWWTFFFLVGSFFLAFVVVGVLVAAAGVLVELVLEPPELPQPATTRAIVATAAIRARFIGWTPLRSQTCFPGYKCFRRFIVAVDAPVGLRTLSFPPAHTLPCPSARPLPRGLPPDRLSRIGPPFHAWVVCGPSAGRLRKI